MLSISEPRPTFSHENVAPTTSPVRPVDPALFLFRHPRPVPTHWRDGPKLTLQLVTWAGFGPFFTSKSPRKFRGEFPRKHTSPPPLPQPADGVPRFGTHLGATGGTKTHSRRTGRRLGQTRWARQGLVRVPESNTKYGGKRRKTGVASCPPGRQVSVSPQGFPSEKNCLHRADFGFVPLFTGQLFIVPEGLLLGDSGRATRLRAAMPA
jgi:hypothetical protein